MNDAMQAQQRLIRAMQNYQMGDLGKAEKELLDLRRKFPKSDQILAMLGAVHFAQKKYKDAFRAYRDALKVNPRNEEATVGIGSAENARGNTAQGIKLLIEATRKFPKRIDAFFNLAMIYSDKPDLKKAEESFLVCVTREPKFVQAHLGLVNIYKAWDKLNKAEHHLRAAIALDSSPILKEKLEELLKLSGGASEPESEALTSSEPETNEAPATDSEEENDSLTDALGIDDSDVSALMSAAQTFMDNNQFTEAEECLRKVLAVEPDNEKAMLGWRRIQSTKIPMWHFEMLADTTRNDAYQQAIEKALAEAPGMRVLDIGTGSGLLAMMSARAGASEVLACEMNETLAEAATGIVKDNGYSEQITVANKKSSDLVEGKDFDKPFDMVVSEILDVGGLGEGVIPSLRDAREKLLTKGAITIPSGITMYAQLVEVPDLYSVNPVKGISGFDLSGFDQFRPVVRYFQVWMEKEKYTALSEPMVFKTFDFYNIQEPRDQENPYEEAVAIPATTNGTVQAVVYWFDLHLDDEISLSSGPGGSLKHWGQAICYLEKPFQVQTGQNARLKAMIADDLLWFET